MTIIYKPIKGQDALSSTLAFALFNLDHKFFPTPWSEESWNNLFASFDRSLMIIEQHHEIIGFSLFDLAHADSFAHLLKILILPEFRAQGLGLELMTRDLMRLKSEGFHHFFLEVEEDNLAAQKLYEALGFKAIHKKKDFYGSGRAALIMTADL